MQPISYPVPEVVARPEHKNGLIKCPACNGLPVVSPHEQKSDVPCVVCKSGGVVNPALVCRECGRPAIFQEQESKVIFCGSTVCLTELKKKVKTKAISQNFMSDNCDNLTEAEAYEHYWATRGGA